jgi:hypothetical protein
VSTISGTINVTDFPVQLQAGTLSGGTWAAINDSSIVLPGPISDLAAGDVDIVGAGEIKAGSANALAGLRTIDTGGELDVAGK